MQLSPGQPGHINNASYVYWQGFWWASPQLWQGYLSGPVVPVKPTRPCVPWSPELSPMTLSAAGARLLVFMDPQGNITQLLPAAGQSW